MVVVNVSREGVSVSRVLADACDGERGFRDGNVDL